MRVPCALLALGFVLLTAQGAPVPSDEQLIQNIKNEATAEIRQAESKAQAANNLQDREETARSAAKEVDSKIVDNAEAKQSMLTSMTKHEKKTIKDANEIEQLDDAKEVEATDADAEDHSQRIDQTAQTLDTQLEDSISQEKAVKKQMDEAGSSQKKELGQGNSDPPSFSDPGPTASFRNRVHVVSKEANRQVTAAANLQQEAAADESQAQHDLQGQQEKEDQVLTKMKASKALLDQDVKVNADTELEADIMTKAEEEEEAPIKSLGESKQVPKEEINPDRKYRSYYGISGTDPKSLGESRGDMSKQTHGIPIWERGLHTNENDPRAAWKPPTDKNEKLGEGGPPEPLEAAEQAALKQMNSHPEESNKSVKRDEGFTPKRPALEAAEQAAEQAADKATKHDEQATVDDTSDDLSIEIKEDAAKLVENQEAAITEIKKQGALMSAELSEIEPAP